MPAPIVTYCLEPWTRLGKYKLMVDAIMKDKARKEGVDASAAFQGALEAGALYEITTIC